MYLQSEKKAFWKKGAPLKPSPTYPQVHRKESLNNFYHYHQYYHFFFTKLTTKIATSFIPKWIAIILEYCYHKRANYTQIYSILFPSCFPSWPFNCYQFEIIQDWVRLNLQCLTIEKENDLSNLRIKHLWMKLNFFQMCLQSF